MTILPDARYCRRVVVMVKEPHPGRVKTRLGRDIGMIGSAWWFRHQTARLLRQIQDPRWQVVLAVSPDHEGLQSRVWPAHLPRFAQGSGDLGARMASVFRSLPPGPVCVVGGDIPGITPRHLEQAFRALGHSDAVFGPAPDGGYWLIGMQAGRVPAGALENVRWSSEHALADSMASLSTDRIALVETLSDIDTAADLAAYVGTG